MCVFFFFFFTPVVFFFPQRVFCFLFFFHPDGWQLEAGRAPFFPSRPGAELPLGTKLFKSHLCGHAGLHRPSFLFLQP